MSCDTNILFFTRISPFHSSFLKRFDVFCFSSSSVETKACICYKPNDLSP